MRILTRRIDETLNIGNQISITVVGIKDNQVLLGIQAPKDIPGRKEVLDRIRRQSGQVP